MATQKTNANPFMDFDMTKVIADFDPAKFADEFAKMAERYSVPGFDMNALMETQRRNIEALTAANQTAAEGVKAVAKQQSAILQQTLNATRKAFDDLGKAGSPQEAATKQAEIAKQVFEKAVANVQAVSELIAKSNAQTAEVITGRISESLDELKTLAEKLEK